VGHTEESQKACFIRLSLLKQIKYDGFRSATVFNMIAVVKLMSNLAIASQEDSGELSICSCKGVYELSFDRISCFMYNVQKRMLHDGAPD
jgi:hypothetical protein